MILKAYPISHNQFAFGWHLGAPEVGELKLKAFAGLAPLTGQIEYVVDKTLDQNPYPSCTAACGTYWGIAVPVVDDWDNANILPLYRLEKEIDGDNADGSTIHTLVKALGPAFGGFKTLHRLERAAFAYDLADVDRFMLAGKGGVMFGMPWCEGMMEVDRDGFVHATGKVVGGHAVFCKGTNRDAGYRSFKQSWGLIPEFPQGDFKIRDDEMDRLWDMGCEAAAAVELPLAPGDPAGPLTPPAQPDGCTALLAALGLAR